LLLGANSRVGNDRFHGGASAQVAYLQADTSRRYATPKQADVLGRVARRQNGAPSIRPAACFLEAAHAAHAPQRAAWSADTEREPMPAADDAEWQLPEEWD
jgi:hypothetical protein